MIKTHSVVAMKAKKANSQAKIELDGVKRSLSILPWDLQVQHVLSFCGLSVSESVLAESVALPSASAAALLEHTTLKELVTRSEDQDGLARDWEEFSAKMTALIYRNKYAIPEREYKEINALVEDASLILGHMPVDIVEFHSAKQQALQSQIQAIENESQTRIEALQEKHSALIRSLSTANEELKSQQEANRKAAQEATDRIEQLRREMANEKQAIEKSANEKIQEETLRLSKEYEEKIARQQSEMNAQLRDAANSRLQIENRLSALQSRVDSGELIPVEQLKEAQQGLMAAQQSAEALRNQLLDMNTALTESQKLTQSLQDENQELGETIAVLNSQINDMEGRVRSIVEDRLGSSEFAVLQERLAQVRAQKVETEERLAEATKANEKQQTQYRELVARFCKMRDIGHEHFGMLNEQISAIGAQRDILVGRLFRFKLITGLLVAALIGTGAFTVVF